MSINNLITEIISAPIEEQVNVLTTFLKKPENKHYLYAFIGYSLTGNQITRMQRMSTFWGVF
jgi:hypothetical protein